MGYYFLGGEVIDTRVPHRWPSPVGEVFPDQTVCWLWPGMWVVEVEDNSPEGRDLTDGYPVRVGDSRNWVAGYRYVYRLDEADAYATLARWGHGPNVWICACEECLCPCGESWHTHPPLALAPDAWQLGACPRLHMDVVRQRLTQEYHAKQRARGRSVP